MLETVVLKQQHLVLPKRINQREAQISLQQYQLLSSRLTMISKTLLLSIIAPPTNKRKKENKRE